MDIKSFCVGFIICFIFMCIASCCDELRLYICEKRRLMIRKRLEDNNKC